MVVNSGQCSHKRKMDWNDSNMVIMLKLWLIEQVATEEVVRGMGTSFSNVKDENYGVHNKERRLVKLNI